MSTMKGTPWEPVPGREGTEVRSRVALPEVAKTVPMAREFVCEERVRRRPNIEKRDVENIGISSGCPGCVAAGRGAPSRHHTEACRKRMEEEMTKGNDERIARYNQRMVEASEEAAPRNEGQQGNQDMEQQHEKRSRTEVADVKENGDEDKGATSSRDPEGSRHSRKRAGGLDEEEERPEKVRREHSGTGDEEVHERQEERR